MLLVDVIDAARSAGDIVHANRCADGFGMQQRIGTLGSDDRRPNATNRSGAPAGTVWSCASPPSCTRGARAGTCACTAADVTVWKPSCTRT